MSYRLIIADDEPKIISLIKTLGHWNQYGIEVIDECSDSYTALDSILEHNPDIVISDIKMPGLDGIELIEEARKRGSKALLIMISGEKSEMVLLPLLAGLNTYYQYIAKGAIMLAVMWFDAFQIKRRAVAANKRKEA